MFGMTLDLLAQLVEQPVLSSTLFLAAEKDQVIEMIAATGTPGTRITPHSLTNCRSDQDIPETLVL